MERFIDRIEEMNILEKEYKKNPHPLLLYTEEDALERLHC